MTPPRRRPFLRDYADQAGPWVERIREAREDLEHARQDQDEDSILALLGPLSEAYRQLGRLDEAVKGGEEAMALAGKLEKPKLLIANGIRLATAYQYRNEHERAEALFAETLAQARAQGFMVDYVLQHLGKCLVELSRTKEAIACFEEARGLRKNYPELLASTEEALAEASFRLV